MVICSAYGCKSRSDKKEIGITFHRFPLKDEERNRLWIQNVQVDNWVPTKNDRLCSQHFEKTSFRMFGGRTYLKGDTVPTLPEELLKQQQITHFKRGTKRSHKQSLETSLGSVASKSLKTSTSMKPIASTLVEPVASTSIEPDALTEVETHQKHKLRRQLFKEKLRSREKSRRIRVLGQKVRRSKKRIILLKKRILIKKNYINAVKSKIMLVCI